MAQNSTSDDILQALYQKVSEQGRPHAQPWNGGLSAQQMTWLQKNLKAAEEREERVILFCHFPVAPHPDIHNLWNNLELIELLESYSNVVAYVNGHNHAGGYSMENGIHYITLQVMVETTDQTAYAVVEVYHDFLHIAGQGREPDRILPYNK